MRQSTCITLLALLICTAAQAGVRAIDQSSAVNAAATTTVGADPRRLYIVQFDGPPALVATRGNGRSNTSANRFDPHATHVRQYINQLQARQNDILLSLNLWQNRVYSYGYTFNGVAIRLTAAEAEKLRQRRGITRVWENTRRSVATSDSPEFLGLLDQPGGLRADLGLTGEGIIVGVIDSGITPNHPSFRDREAAKKAPRVCRSEWAENSWLGLWLCRRFDKPGRVMFGSPPQNWRGVCATGPGFAADTCNNKLVGARFYKDGFEAGGAPDEDEFASPADADGHGTHIASIVAGNRVDAAVYGKSLGAISGIAPRARVAVYKACWLEPGAARATCSVADLAKAIEDAVADGVDIINYSIGDTNSSLDDPDDLALLAATEAGVLSVVATGNDGPENRTIQSPATTPWVISVGATSRAGTKVTQAVRISSPESLARDYESREGGFTPRLANSGAQSGRLVLVDDGSTETGDDTEGNSFDACTAIENSSEVRGNIALIQRGYCNFDLKIALAQNAGAKAVVVFNNESELLVMDGDPGQVNIPAVMIGQADGQLIRDKLLAGADVRITLDSKLFSTLIDDGNVIGAYSGRGPNFGDSDFLKPDIVAPGTNILGGHTPDVANGFRGEYFQYLSGTSQAAPHVAGAAALIRQAHPDWSPAEIKSALMTSSRQNIVKENGSVPATPFDMGAGHMEPNSAVNPGLVYPADIAEYDAYLCRYGLERTTREDCQSIYSAGFRQDARDINLPSVAVTELAGTVEVSRRVKNVGPATRYSFSADLPDGISLSVEPESLTLANGETGKFTLSFFSDGSGLGSWHHGSFSWVSDNHTVYSPFVVQPTTFSAPLNLLGDGASGSLELAVGFGYTGEYAARVNGLIAPCILPDNNTADDACTNTEAARVADDSNDLYMLYNDDDLPDSVKRFYINIPEQDDELLRIALFDSLTSGADDLDIYLYYCRQAASAGLPELPCQIVEPDAPFASATPGTSNELIDIEGPAAGTWIVDVHGYDTASPGGTDFRLYAWSFGSNSATGNLSLSNAPASATAGSTLTMDVGWEGLAEGLWLGGITHYDNPGDPNDIPMALTVIEIDNSPRHDW